ncbi:MAG: helix-turn-helix domain-containing protein [Patescibacteria group bacterium]|nr:helix-turn-helix domain-containing protein [Patescibacteria group bacterium]
MLEDLLVSSVRIKILNLFFSANAAEFYHVRHITREVGTEINAVRRELQRLTKAGLLKKEPRGNRVYYRVRESSPYFVDIYNLVNKESGLSKALLSELDKLGAAKLIILSKLFLKGRAPDQSEIDLLIVGRVNQDLVSKIVKAEEAKLKKEINYTILTEDEFDFRKKRKDPFLINILLQPRLVIFGDELAYGSARI